MYISKIELTKFKSYQHAELKFPEPTEGKNIVLIGGMNGFGKTTILEALYLCLYGKDALPHLARAGLKTDDVRGYPTFLEKALNGEAKRDGADNMMSVRIVINRTKTKGIDITRRWYFRANGNWRDEETIVREVNRDVAGTPRKDGERGFSLSEMLEEQYVPAHIAPFFFFDGEEVKKLADQSRIEQVKQGLEGLLGVVLLRNLSERLKAFEDSKRSRLTNFDQGNLEQLQQKLQEEETKLTAAKTALEKNKEETDQLKAERKSLLDRIVAAGGGGGEIATVKDLVEEREQLRNAKKTAEGQLSKIVADKLPFYLMPNRLLQDFKEQINSEIALTKWQTECRALQPKQEKFFYQLLKADNFAFTPDLNPEQLSALEKRVEAAWQSLFLPPPPNCADEFVHDYLHDELKQKAIKFLSGLTVGQKEVNDLLMQKADLEKRIDEVSRQISRIEGIDRDGTLTELKNQLNAIMQKSDALESQTGNMAREIVSLEAIIHQTRATYESERQRRDSTSPDRSLIDKSERTRKVIEDVIPQLFPLKVRQLSLAMTRVYKQLAHKSQVSKIVIDDDGTTTILSANGKELNFDRSAGENQIFATALIAGLAEVSKIHAPLVVDTPLGRLDSMHRANIFGFWTSDESRQVILLSQDEEISPAHFKTIKKNVCKTYLLEHSEVGDGIGRTIAKEDKYFNGAV
jgi:DNA sulfur modification protein DndD